MTTKKDGATPGAGAPQRTTSSQFRLRLTHRDDGPASSPGEVPPPSTLPPLPFEREADVHGHEWWLEKHMNAAADVLCLEQHVDAVMDSADVVAIDRVRVMIGGLAAVRDALYELYCDAADPRMQGGSTPDGPLTSYITRLYAWCEAVGDRLATVTTAMRDAPADWSPLAALVAEGAPLLAEDARRAVRESVNALGADFASPYEPLRNLPKDIEQMFAAANTLRAEVQACLA